MVTFEELRSFGWHISEKGLATLLNDSANKDVKTVIKLACNADLKDIGNSTILSTKEFDKKILGPIVLQIQKVRNVAAPKINEHSEVAPRMLKLTLSDGQNQIQAIEREPIHNLNWESLPGTKICLKNAPVLSSIIQLKPSNTTVLGGEVPALVEKWQLSKFDIIKNRESSRDAPPWVPFGKSIVQVQESSNFKSLEVKQPSKKKTEVDAGFNAQRQDAIAEATHLTTNVKKVFGGGRNVQLPVKDNTNRSRPEPRMKTDEVEKDDRPTSRPTKLNRRAERRKGKEETTEPQKKPSGAVSLFDFLETKLPAETALNIAIRESIKESNNAMLNASTNLTSFSKPPNTRSQYDNYNRYESRNGRNEMARKNETKRSNESSRNEPSSKSAPARRNEKTSKTTEKYDSKINTKGEARKSEERKSNKNDLPKTHDSKNTVRNTNGSKSDPRFYDDTRPSRWNGCNERSDHYDNRKNGYYDDGRYSNYDSYRGKNYSSRYYDDYRGNKLDYYEDSSRRHDPKSRYDRNPKEESRKNDNKVQQKIETKNDSKMNDWSDFKPDTSSRSKSMKTDDKKSSSNWTALQSKKSYSTSNTLVDQMKDLNVNNAFGGNPRNKTADGNGKDETGELKSIENYKSRSNNYNFSNENAFGQRRPNDNSYDTKNQSLTGHNNQPQTTANQNLPASNTSKSTNNAYPNVLDNCQSNNSTEKSLHDTNKNSMVSTVNNFYQSNSQQHANYYKMPVSAINGDPYRIDPKLFQYDNASNAKLNLTHYPTQPPLGFPTMGNIYNETSSYYRNIPPNALSHLSTVMPSTAVVENVAQNTALGSSMFTPGPAAVISVIPQTLVPATPTAAAPTVAGAYFHHAANLPPGFFNKPSNPLQHLIHAASNSNANAGIPVMNHAYSGAGGIYMNANNNALTSAPLNDPTIITAGSCNWKVGDKCMARYWEDNKFYEATITNTTDRTCVVRFNGYGNIEEVLKQDCFLVKGETSKPSDDKNQEKLASFGSLVFHRTNSEANKIYATNGTTASNNYG